STDLSHSDDSHRALHSFPTRRSSDLTPISGKAIREIPFENASEAVTLCLDQLTGEEGWPPALQGETFALERQAYREAIARAEVSDRKSTRLNSSHEWISYAVFCLKKK